MDKKELERYILYCSKVELILDELKALVPREDIKEALNYFIHGEEGLSLDSAIWYIVKNMTSISIDLKVLIDDFLSEFEPDGIYLGKEIVEEYLEELSNGNIKVI
ncbi:hypothetical protein A9Q91_00740 [Candidatus Gracilibacteria bacterium 28_42_T64]|nr:hypothetical protein A9Q91_00740 [Candidatus Gracilibacteria bacterium 28_42_T64]